MFCCGLVAFGLFGLRDFRIANAEAREMYTRSVQGLKVIAELQYDAQETRRCTLYALSTTDSNLQVQYADQSRDADKQVSKSLADVTRQAASPYELSVVNRLSREWDEYLGLRDEVVASILEGSTKEAVSLDLSAGEPAFERVRMDVAEVQRLYDEDASRREANLAASLRRSSIKLVGILSLMFLMSILAVWAIQRSRMLSTIQLAKLQMEFVASVSHELRTPLAVMRSAADNLADGVVTSPESVAKYGATLKRQTRNMAELVDQILLFASTEDRKAHNALEAIPVTYAIAAALDGMRSQMHDSGFQIEQSIEPGLPPLWGNQAGITQCLQNLVGNALKYSDQSRKIRISACAAPAHTIGKRELRISVSDDGIGIEPSELNHIFEPFYRSSRVRATQIHGTGLGLSLATRIAESMGGRISVMSELAVGSTFTLHLKFAEDNASARDQKPSHMEEESNYG
jgi:signal transduction histidine kinase